MNDQDLQELLELQRFSTALKQALNLMGDEAVGKLSLAMLELAEILKAGLEFSALDEEKQEILNSASRFLGDCTYGALWRAHRDHERTDALVAKHLARAEIQFAASSTTSEDSTLYN